MSYLKRALVIWFLLAAALSCADAAQQLQLSWTDNANNEDGFKIERGPSSAGPFTQIGTVLSNITTYTDTGLADATAFCYQVRAYNSAGDSAYTNAACGTTPATLTLVKAGTGSGTVTSAPAGINCGSTCSFSYTSGASVTLTATAATGSTFSGWTGACTGTGACVITMDGAKSVTAEFSIPPPLAPSSLAIN
jgi:Divergent InlB B-repeat domain